jgi:hypothetical protein
MDWEIYDANATLRRYLELYTRFADISLINAKQKMAPASLVRSKQTWLSAY